MFAKKPRTILGFIIAPLVVPLTYFAFGHFLGKGSDGVSEFVGTLLTYGVYAYGFAVVLGVPTFFFLRRRRAVNLWSCALAAGVIGLMGAGILTTVGLKLAGVLIGGLAGFLAGIVFFFVAGA
jgi:hypothetical protein